MSLGVTPSAKTLSAITNATQTVYNTGYNKGVAGATKQYVYKVFTFAQYSTTDEGSTQTYTCPADGKIMCAAFASASGQVYDWGSAWTEATSTSGSTVTTYASASGKFNTDSYSSRWCRAYNSSGWVNATKGTVINISGGGEARWGGYVTLVFVY